MSRTIAVLALLVISAAIATGCAGFGGSAPTTYAGSVLVFVQPGPVEGLGVDNTDLVAVSPSGRPVADFTPGTAAETGPVWSANGRRVAFVRLSVVAAGRVSAGEPRYRLVRGLYAMDTNGSNLRLVTVCANPCSTVSYAISPDGRYVAYVHQSRPRSGLSTNGGQVVVVFDTQTGHTRTLCSHNSCGFGLGGLVWSPDGRSIALSNQNAVSLGYGPLPSQIWVVDVASGRTVQLTGRRCRHDYRACTTDTYPTWSPDGRQLAFSRTGPFQVGGPPPSGWMLMNADGSGLHTLAICSNALCPQAAQPVWSPDGRYLAVPNDVEGSTIAILPAGGGRSRDIRTCQDKRCQTPASVAWSPDSRTLAFTTDRYPRTDVYTIGIDGKGMRAVGIAAAYAGVAWLPPGVVVPAPVSKRPPPAGRPPRPAGQLAYAGQESRPQQNDRSIWVQPASGGSRRLIARRRTPNLWLDDPKWSPDGGAIVMDYCCSRGKRNIFEMSASGAGRHPLTGLPYGASGADWSPDGRRIVFSANSRYSASAIDVMNADGSRIRTVTAGASDSEPSWSPDGRWIVFVRGSDSSDPLIELVRPDGTGLHPVVDLPGALADPAWSPDGRWIAFEWNLGPGIGDNIYEIHPDGTGLRRLTAAFDGAADPAFSPDGRWIAFASGLGGRVDIYLTPVDTFQPVRLSPRQGIYDDPDWRR